ncbi:MAG: CD225/dispanin family protein [Rubripirellula sp.]
MSMFCRKCGTENADGAPSCISCGEPLTNPFEPTAAGGPVNAAGKPENYLIQSILVTLCCCLPLGIVSIVYAAQVDSKWNAGDHQGAINASENAKKWSWIAFGLGIVLNLLAVGLQIVAGVAAQNAGGGGF